MTPAPALISNGVCGGAPTLPSYVTALPSCLCGLNPQISVTKICVLTGNSPFTVQFEGKVCNTGNEEVMLTKLTDNQPNPNTNIFAQLSKTLLPVADPNNPGNECATYAGSFNTQNNPSSDTVTAEGKGFQSNIVVMGSAQATCANLPPPVCGNGVKDPGEQCDDGNQNDNDGCSNACKLPVCGDGVKQGNEQCDDGNQNNNDACKNDCTPNICGDGFVGSGEQCDDGNQNNNDSCRNDCTPPPPPGGGQGCTLGYWKQSQHFDDWTPPYTPTGANATKVGDVFTMSTCVGAS